MKKIALTMLLLTSLLTDALSSHAQAQLLDSGAVVTNNITVPTIDGHTFDLFSYLDQGYTVVIDLFATWCNPCWNFDQYGPFKQLYLDYGPEGTIASKKVMPVSIEVDPSTDLADLQGTGSKTQGDYVTGNPYPIVNLTAAQLKTVMGALVQGGGQFNYQVDLPAFLMICPNHTIIHSSMGFGTLDYYTVTGKMDQCPAATKIQFLRSDANKLQLYPNPTTSGVFVVNTSLKHPMSVQITNAIGQEIYQTVISGRKTPIDLSTQPDGLYFLHIHTEQGDMVKKIILAR